MVSKQIRGKSFGQKMKKIPSQICRKYSFINFWWRIFVYFQKTSPRPFVFWQQRGIDKITPTMKTEKKQSTDGNR